MLIHDQMTVRAVFVLADFGMDEGSLAELGKSLREKLLAARSLPRRGSVAAGRIEIRAPVSSAILNRGRARRESRKRSARRSRSIRKAAREIAFRSWGSPEVVNLLSGWPDPLANHVGEEPPQPRPAGEHEEIASIVEPSSSRRPVIEPLMMGPGCA